MHLRELAGYDLGTHAVAYTARDAILYALSVGAPPDRLDLVYERDLRVLPSFACALGLWAVERAGDLGAYDRKRSLHAAQTLLVHRPLPRDGRIAMRGAVSDVLDKGKATIVNIAVESEFFIATYAIFLPGMGNWGGPQGPAVSAEPRPDRPVWRARHATAHEFAALYRLTGDLHPIHIDPEVARANGFDRPILHGLCTLGIAARMLAGACGGHPGDLVRLSARLSAPVLPGDTIEISAATAGGKVAFDASVNGSAVLKDGQAVFAM